MDADKTDPMQSRQETTESAQQADPETRDGPAQRFEEVNGPDFLERLRSSGDSRQKAFRRLVEVTHGPLMSYIRKFVSSADEGQEILQEVYLGVHKSLPRFEGKAKLTTWIYGLAHNKVCDRLADKHRRLVDLEEGHPGPQTAQTLEMSEWHKATPWELPPDKVLFQSALRTLIARAVAELPPPAFEIYFLRDIEGLTGEEVSEILGISPAAVRVRLHRARNGIVECVKRLMQAKGPAKESA